MKMPMSGHGGEGMMFSLICPSNKPEMVDAMVKRSLASQRAGLYELIVVDTAACRYPSAGAALNAGAGRARGDYLVFLHHDLSFDSPSFLDRLADGMKGSDLLVPGVAGCVRGGNLWRKWMYTNILHGELPHRPFRSSGIDRPMPCESLDECFFVVPRKVWERRQFPEFHGGWHLYAVEYCLWANNERPGSVVVLPLSLWHHSAGASFDEGYYRSLRMLRKMYSGSYRFIYTPLGAWPTNPMLFRLRIAANRLKRVVDRLRGAV